ncbi:MAG: glyoxalase [Phycisphaerae bacterium]|jgi:catechol 2,3-dioxygenase-like lactoylglutathione lyase family enzyme|nr:glyoxalase [Phycisphaerae bacterium]
MRPRAHFILYVSDQERATEFYRVTLAVAPRLHVPGMTEFDIPPGGNGEAVLGLMPVAGIRRLLGDAWPSGTIGCDERCAPKAEVYLYVPDPATFHGRALASGARELSSLALRDWGDRVAYSLDLDGHVLAFASGA